MGCGGSKEENESDVSPSASEDNVLSPVHPGAEGKAPKAKKKEPPPIKMSKAQELALKRKKEEEEAEEKKKNARLNPRAVKNANTATRSPAPQRKASDASPGVKKSESGEVAPASPNVPLPGAVVPASQPAAEPAPTFTAKDFVGFKTGKVLGKGSFGTTYECGLKSCRMVCVKVIELGDMNDTEELESLRQEIIVMQRLEHPNIVQYYGTTEDKAAKTINIFMELVGQGSLNTYMKKFPRVPYDTAKDWARQMLVGIKYLHDHKVVHRDIKGANILVTQTGVLKLADFGCSKAIDQTVSKTRGCQTMVGTPYWMAPEVLKCEPYGTKSDIWSIGCTIVEVVTGKAPWPEMDNMWAAVYKIANSSGPPPTIPKDCPSKMLAFLNRCFERDPRKRASADELLGHAWLKDA